MLPRGKSKSQSHNQPRSLVASAVLLACLALAAQSHARAVLASTPIPGARPQQAFAHDLTALVARAQRLLTTGPAPVSRSLFKATLDHPATTATAAEAGIAHLSISGAQPVFHAASSLSKNARWMRTSRAWAS